MSWDVGSSDTVEVVLVRNGRETAISFPSDTTVGEAVSKMARENGLTSVIVKDSDGNEINQSRSDEELGDVGRITLTPKNTGAK